MENELKLNLGEAFGSLFQKGWFAKSLGAWCCLLIPIVVTILTIIMFWLGAGTKNVIFYILGIVFILLTVISYVISSFAIFGYYYLYSHDRALDKNAQYRDWSKETIAEALITGAKTSIFGLIQLPFRWIVNIAVSIPFAIIALPLVIGGSSASEPIANLLNIISSIAANLVYILGLSFVFTKVAAHYVKDLTVGSIFDWGSAFRRAKGVKGVVLVPFIPYLYSFVMGILLLMLFIGSAALVGTLSISQPDLSIIIMVILCVVLVIFLISIVISQVALQANLLGQYAYNVIENNKDENVQQ